MTGHLAKYRLRKRFSLYMPMDKTVIITGSSKGFGFEMGKEFLRKGYNVAFSSSHEQNLRKAMDSFTANRENVTSVICDIKIPGDLKKLWDVVFKKWGRVDIWINNAGVAQKSDKIWESSVEEVKAIFDINLLGTFYGTQVAVNGMITQGFGKIYNTVGFGSNGLTRVGLNLYGTSKCAIAYFSKAFAKELKGMAVIVGTLQPGMMVTDFVKASSGSVYNKLEVQQIYNILGDYPDVPAKFLVKRMIKNNVNGKLLSWQSNARIVFRFAKYLFFKRDLFKPDVPQK